MADRGRKAFPVSSALLDDKWTKHNQKLHRERLQLMKKMIDNAEPITTARNPGRHNVKKAQKAMERQEQVDTENQILLDKLVKIKTTDTRHMFRPFLSRSTFQLKTGLYYDTNTGRKCLDHYNVPASHVSIMHSNSRPASADYRKQQAWVNTLHQNSKLLRAIEETKPFYSVDVMEDQHIKNCAHSTRLSNFRGPEHARYVPHSFTPIPRSESIGSHHWDFMSAYSAPTPRSMPGSPRLLSSVRRVGSAQPLRPTKSSSMRSGEGTPALSQAHGHPEPDRQQLASAASGQEHECAEAADNLGEAASGLDAEHEAAAGSVTAAAELEPATAVKEAAAAESPREGSEAAAQSEEEDEFEPYEEEDEAVDQGAAQLPATVGEVSGLTQMYPSPRVLAAQPSGESVGSTASAESGTLSTRSKSGASARLGAPAVPAAAESSELLLAPAAQSMQSVNVVNVSQRSSTVCGSCPTSAVAAGGDGKLNMPVAHSTCAVGCGAASQAPTPPRGTIAGSCPASAVMAASTAVPEAPAAPRSAASTPRSRVGSAHTSHSNLAIDTTPGPAAPAAAPPAASPAPSTAYSLQSTTSCIAYHGVAVRSSAESASGSRSSAATSEVGLVSPYLAPPSRTGSASSHRSTASLHGHGAAGAAGGGLRPGSASGSVHSAQTQGASTSSDLSYVGLQPEQSA